MALAICVVVASAQVGQKAARLSFGAAVGGCQCVAAK
jgi:hypothetical protein